MYTGVPVSPQWLAHETCKHGHCFVATLKLQVFVIRCSGPLPQCYNKLGLHGDAIKDCDLAIQASSMSGGPFTIS